MDDMKQIPSPDSISKIRILLTEWYRSIARDLPWRHTRDPYAIWISEIMLQQTQVDTVIPFYKRFIQRFPDPKALAEATDDELMRHWEGMGYYSRARNLKKAAGILLEKFGGQFPSDPAQFGELPGIGPYTVGAIASIAFGIPLPAVDGNVVRVYSRLFCCEESWDTTSGKKYFASLGATLTDPSDPSAYNQGVMELGALVCTPSNPQCSQCPLNTQCCALSSDRISEFPLPRRKTEKTTFSFAVPIVICDSNILFTRRTEPGPLQGLWGFPTVLSEKESAQKNIDLWLADQGFSGYSVELHSVIRHIFSHQIWLLYPVFINVSSMHVPSSEYQWCDRSEIPPISTAFRKVLQAQFAE